MAKYLSTKTYGNDRGLSCCFRQWRSRHSHCSTLHGYSIGIKLIFESETLDDRNWVMDFGGLKAFKEWSEYMFDHTLVIGADDPHLNFFKQMANLGDPPASGTGTGPEGAPHERGAICDLRIVEAVGCEKFSELAYKTMENILKAFQAGNSWFLVAQDGTTLKEFQCRYPVGQGVKLRSVEVFEHNANSASYEG
jgi:6-pyruvoyltetrahydropterin/6-carboxytetrahydropterin synthase